LCGEETAKRLGRPAVRIAGAATATDSFWVDRDLAAAPTFKRVVADGLRSAGWDDVPERVELSAPFAHQALLFARELGHGGGAAAFERGVLSPTGGWLGGRPGVVAGLSAALAGARELREGGGRALAHGTT